MSENEKTIKKILGDFEEAMSRLEVKSNFAEIFGKNCPTPQEIYAKHKRQNDERTIRHEILKRVLWLNLGTEAEQIKMLKPAAKKAVDEAMKELEKKLRNMTFDIDIEF